MTGKKDTNLDQQQAEALVLKAKTPEEWAAAMNLHFNAVRNLQQTEIVPSFQHAVEVMFDKQIQKVLDQVNAALQPVVIQGNTVANNQIDLAAKVNEWKRETQIRLDAFKTSQDSTLAAVEGVAANVGKLEESDRRQAADIEALKAEQLRQAAIIAERPSEQAAILEGQAGIANQVREVIGRLDNDERRLDAKRERIEILEQKVAKQQEWIDRQPTPEQSQELIALLKKLATERGGDGNG